MLRVSKEVLLILFGVLLFRISQSDGPHKRIEQKITGNMALMNESEVHHLHALLKRKMEAVRDVIIHGHASTNLKPLDPFRLGTLHIVVQESGAFLNMTLSKTTVSGLSELSVRDVSTSAAHLRASVLMSLPKVTIECRYRLKGYLYGSNGTFQSLKDEGDFRAVVSHAAISWYARLLNVAEDDVLVTQTGLRTHMEEAEQTFRSRAKTSKKKYTQSADIVDLVGNSIIDEVRMQMEKRLNEVVSLVVTKAEPELQQILEHTMLLEDNVPHTFSYRNTYKEDEEEVHDLHHIRKRQVPCNNGTELDDYVDYLFRFARRLIRVMEPIAGPNVTVYVEDHLQVFLYDLKVRGVNTLGRKKPSYVICNDKGDVRVGIVVNVERMFIKAKYRVIHDFRHMLFGGEADIKITEPLIWVQIAQLGNGNNNLDVFRVWRTGKVHVRLKGLGSVTSALSMFMTKLANDEPWNIIPLVEAQGIVFGRDMLSNVTVPIFSLV